MLNISAENVLYYFSDEEIQTFIEKIDFTFVSAIVASICFLIAIMNILILLSSSFFWKYNKILIALAFASMISLISLSYQNFYQYDQYRIIISFGFIEEKTSWDCAILTWVWLKLIADLWPPAIQAIMGVERAIAVYRPAYYRKVFAQRVHYQIFITVAFVILSITVAYVIAVINIIPGFATCGRKNAFSKEYGVYLYLVNIFGYFISFILSFIAFIKAKGKSVPSNIQRKQLTKAKFYVLISFISVICISAPNISSIINAFFPKLPNFISKPAAWMACANFASNIFVSFALNPEFRQHCKKLLHLQKNTVVILKTDTVFLKSTSHFY